MPTETATSPVAVWRTLMEVHASVLATLESELRAHHGLSVSEFDTLVNLPPDGARHSELADRVILSRSALTRLVDRLERRGLVTRERCDPDQRGIHVRLTEAGHRLRRESARTNARVVRAEVGGRLSEADSATLARILSTLRQ